MGEFGNDFIVLTDEEGNEFEFEHIDTAELNGNTYMAFVAAELALEEEAEITILKIAQENGEELLISLSDEEEMNEAYNCFVERLENEFEMEPLDS